MPTNERNEQHEQIKKGEKEKRERITEKRKNEGEWRNEGLLGDPSPFTDGDAKWCEVVGSFCLLKIRASLFCG